MRPFLILVLSCLLALPAQGGELLTRMTQYMDGASITWTPVEGVPNLVRSGIPGPSGAAYLVLVQELEAQHQIVVYAVAEKKVPEHRRSAVAEYVSRANYGLPIGNFEIDVTDGELRFKTSMDLEGGVLTAKMAENLLVLNLQTMDRYTPGALKVAFDNGKPAAIIAEIEG
ncbi:MAG: YbjN domain-containing protein [Proteobacteria bacterium]|nr:YbjN domain-containing protein [Pseudomonadota bacterium]